MLSWPCLRLWLGSWSVPLWEQLFKSTPPTTFFLGPSLSGPLSICPNHPKATCQTQPWYPQSLLGLIEWADDKPADPALPFPSHGNRSKGSCPQLLPLLLPQNWPLWFPGCPTPTPGVTLTSSLRICWVEETIFQWQLSWDVLTLPYLNNNKTYLNHAGLGWAARSW